MYLRCQYFDKKDHLCHIGERKWGIAIGQYKNGDYIIKANRSVIPSRVSSKAVQFCKWHAYIQSSLPDAYDATSMLKSVDYSLKKLTNIFNEMKKHRDMVLIDLTKLNFKKNSVRKFLIMITGDLCYTEVKTLIIQQSEITMISKTGFHVVDKILSDIKCTRKPCLEETHALFGNLVREERCYICGKSIWRINSKLNAMKSLCTKCRD